MDKTTERTILKGILGICVVLVLAVGSFIVMEMSEDNPPTQAVIAKTVMVTKASAPIAPAAAQDIVVIRAQKTEPEEEDFDEDDLTQQELDNLQVEITEDQAIRIAVSHVNGPVTDVEFERKRGYEVYAVEIDDNGDETDVYVDIKTGKVVGIDRDSEEIEEDDD
jgi:uncharacterized membrane protein YkoI